MYERIAVLPRYLMVPERDVPLPEDVRKEALDAFVAKLRVVLKDGGTDRG